MTCVTVQLNAWLCERLLSEAAWLVVLLVGVAVLSVRLLLLLLLLPCHLRSVRNQRRRLRRVRNRLRRRHQRNLQFERWMKAFPYLYLTHQKKSCR